MKISINNNYNKTNSSNHLMLTILLIALICAILGSRWIVLAYGISETFSKRLMLFLYLMLAFFLAIKIAGDYFQKKFSLVTSILHVFFIYSVFIITIRFVSGVEVKNTIYWTIILLGSISAAELVFNSSYKRQTIKIETIINDFTSFGLFVVAYKALYVLYLNRIIAYDPLNTNKECGIMLIVIPCSVLGYLMYGRKKYVIGILLFSLVILYSGSRGGLLLYAFEIVAIYTLFIRHNYKVTKWLLFLLLSAFVLSVIITLNVGNIQNYIIRALGTIAHKSSIMFSTIEQISRSDAGRHELYDFGYKEFLKSPLFGTGIVYFRQTINGMGVFSQSAHNFILETLDCFGLLGLMQLALLYIGVFFKMPKYNKCKSYFTILSIAFFGYSMVEPFLYDPFVFLTYCMAVVIFQVVSNDNSIVLYKNAQNQLSI